MLWRRERPQIKSSASRQASFVASINNISSSSISYQNSLNSFFKDFSLHLNVQRCLNPLESRELIERMEHQLHFKCAMAISKEPEGHPVYFKVDGQRFRNTRTIKLHAGTAYKFNFTFKPSQVLESVNIHGANVAVTCNESCSGEGIASSYTAIWSTEGIPLTKKGQRDNIPIILKIADKGTLKTSMQTKFYKADDKHHCEWGNHFSNIEFECNANEHRNHVDIAKETFR